MQPKLSSPSPSRRRPGRHILLLLPRLPLSTLLTNSQLARRIPWPRQEQGVRSKRRAKAWGIASGGDPTRARAPGWILVPVPRAPVGSAVLRSNCPRPCAVTIISRRLPCLCYLEICLGLVLFLLLLSVRKPCLACFNGLFVVTD
jgi:hypothetical protein